MKNERINKLNAMGIDTGKYFTVNLPEGLAKNSTITLSINENGECIVANTNGITTDLIANQIIEDGYVRNTKLHRRFVMAQMFKGLNFVSWYGKSGYNEWVKIHGFKYTFNFMIEEIKVLSKLETRDLESFEERSKFFTREIIAKTMEDYIKELDCYINKSKTYNCKGLPYKKVKGKDVFVVDIDKKFYVPLRVEISRIKRAKNYKEIHQISLNFMSKMINLPWNTPQSKAWVDAYKGEGAFYTLKNLLMFHNCGVEINNRMVYGAAAISVLNKKLNEYQGEGWRMFAFMKKVIKDNNFDFKARMEEIYN
jgi:hypothetical protein